MRSIAASRSTRLRRPASSIARRSGCSTASPKLSSPTYLDWVKLVSRAEIEEADWSLTPGRYVGVAPAEVDEEFDFEQAMRDIHTELADMNREAVELASKIQENFEELGI